MRLIIVLLFALISNQSFSQDYYLFIGTYTSGSSEGIYVYRFNASNGDAQPVDSIASKNPSYLAISPGGKYVYAVSETGGGQEGEVCAYTFDKATGKLSFLNKQLTGGKGPCYVSESRDSKWLMVAN